MITGTGCVLTCMLLSGVPAAPASSDTGERPAVPSSVSLEGTSLEGTSLEDQVAAYCHTYLSALATLYGEGTPLVGQTFRIRGLHKASALKTWFSNAFQPPGARFHANYTCRFHIHVRGQEHPGSVQLLLVGNREFAHHTQWKRIQIVDHGEVVDANGDRYYVVVKYLEVDDRFLHVRTNPDSPFFTNP